MKKITYGQIEKRFVEKYPNYAKQIDDYRPCTGVCAITIWLKNEMKLNVKYNPESDCFCLLDIGEELDIFKS